METSIHHHFFFPHSPAVVWEYLTKAELMEQWLMKNDFQPIIGYDFQFTAKPAPSINFDGIVYCKVLEVVPLKKLSYSWKLGPRDGKIEIDSIVVWKLQPKEKGTELFLDHTGFKELDNFNMFTAMKEGWLKNIHKIAALIEAAKSDETHS